MRSASSREIACSPNSVRTVTGPAERRLREHFDARVRDEPELAEVAQELRVAVRDARDRSARARLEVEQRPALAVDEAQLAVRNRVAVRVVRREAELLVDLRLELLGQRVLEELRLGVHLVEREPEPIDEVALEQAVVPQDLERAAPSLVGERDAAVREPLDQAELVEPLRHRRRRRAR